MACALLKDTMVWVGPSDAMALAADFESFFFMRTQVDASVFSAQDLPAAIAERRIGHGSRSAVPPEKRQDATLPMLQSTEKARERVAYYMEQKLSERQGSATGICADITQDAKLRPRCGPWMPALQKSSQMVWIDESDPQHGHVYTARELASSHGWPALQSIYSHCAPFDFGSLQHSVAQAFLGNAMHLHTMTAWQVYVMANSLRRCVVREFLPDLHMMVVECPDKTDDADGDNDSMCPEEILESEPLRMTPPGKRAKREVSGRAG